jgi:protoporphyrinogen oxidase
MTMRRERWGIVGGGILGMTLAHRLAQRDQEVVLFESADQLGGLASAWCLGDIVWDRHYHVTLLSDHHLRSLLAELGLDDQMEWVQTRTGFYTDGRLHSMSNSLEFLRFPPLGLWDKIRLAATIIHASRITDWQYLEQIPVADWLRRWSGERTWERIWLPLLRSKLGENYTKASAAFIWAIIARMYAARRSGLKKEMFGYVRGGYARILERFGAVLTKEGVDIRLGERVSHVEGDGDRVSVHFANGREELVDRAVVTAPAPYVARLCPGLRPEEKAAWQGITYQGIVCASLVLKQPLAHYYVTNITEPWVPFTAVIEMSALVDRRHFGGNSLVYLPKYLAPDDPFFEVPDHEVEKRFVDALTRMYPHFQPSDVLSFRVSRVRNVLALSTIDYSARLPSMITSIPGVSIVNSAHIVNGTLNVNESIQLAQRAMPLLWAKRTTGMPTPLSLGS